jgi:hypothetical protein
MDVHPNNTASKFTTVLPHHVELKGDWEVALTEISFPGTRHNVTSEEHWFQLNNHHIGLPDNYYTSLKCVLEKMIEVIRLKEEFTDATLTNVKVTRETGNPPRITYDTVGIMFEEDIGKVVFIIPRTVTIKLSRKLADVLGFERNILDTSDGQMVQNSKTPYLNDYLSMAFVYCDLIESTIVGDTRVPLLRTVKVDVKSQPLIHRTYTNPIYVPLQKKHFDSVEINIMTDTGDPVPFVPGKSVVVLHFRRSVNPYFLSR